MKIALLTPTFSPFSGIDRVVDHNAEELIKQGHQVTIFALKAEMKPKHAGLIELGMPRSPFFQRLYRLFFFLDFLKIKKYTKLLKQYDKVVSNFYPMNWLALSAKKHYNIHYEYYDYGVCYPELFQNFQERIYMKLFRFLTNFTAKPADSAISISNFLKKDLQNSTGLKSKVIYVQIDKKRFRKGISGENIRKKYNLRASPLCLYVGRISPHKGIHLLIKAFNLVLKQIPDAKLLIGGKHTFGNYATHLKTLADKVDPEAIIFTGFIPEKDLPSYYSAADIYTTASLWEGFDMPIVEAAGCDTPTVAFDIGSHPEVLKKGKLVQKNNIKEFSEAVIELLRKTK